MKELPIALSKRAMDDLDNIRIYTLEITKSREVTERYLDRLFDFIERIGWVPRGGYRIGRFAKEHRRRTFERSVVIVYQVDTKRILVKRIFWGRLDIAAFRR